MAGLKVLFLDFLDQPANNEVNATVYWIYLRVKWRREGEMQRNKSNKAYNLFSFLVG